VPCSAIGVTTIPRNGSNIYSKPAGTTAVPNSVIESSKYNETIDDLVADANLARPVTAGGTGGVTAIAGADGLSTKGADIASATTTDIGAATGRYVHITGTTTITGFGTKTAGVVRILTFDGALLLTHNATSMILPGGASITTAAGDVAVMVSEGSGNWRCASYQKATGASVITSVAKGYIYGLTLSNNVTDATNDIDIATGEAASDGTVAVLMTLASAITKRLDVAWAVGTGNGGLDTGSIADTSYHVWLIQRSDTGVVDVLFSASATSPTMPTNYDRKRRIGSIVRESATIVPFTQNGDEFLRKTARAMTPVANPGATAVTRALFVPTGVVVYAKFNFLVKNAGSAVAAAPLFTPLDVTDQAASTNGAAFGALASGGPANNTSGNTATVAGEMTVRTNTSAQIRTRLEGSDVNVGLYMSTLGWIDGRGKW